MFGFLLLSFILCSSAGAAARRRHLGLGSNGCEANCRCSAVTDRYTGAILPLGTGLLTVFLNEEVSVLPGLKRPVLYNRRSFVSEPG